MNRAITHTHKTSPVAAIHTCARRDLVYVHCTAEEQLNFRFLCHCGVCATASSSGSLSWRRDTSQTPPPKSPPPLSLTPLLLLCPPQTPCPRQTPCAQHPPLLRCSTCPAARTLTEDTLLFEVNICQAREEVISQPRSNFLFVLDLSQTLSLPVPVTWSAWQ